MENLSALRGYLMKEKSKTGLLHGLTGDINKRYFKVQRIEVRYECAVYSGEPSRAVIVHQCLIRTFICAATRNVRSNTLLRVALGSSNHVVILSWGIWVSLRSPNGLSDAWSRPHTMRVRVPLLIHILFPEIAFPQASDELALCYYKNIEDPHIRGWIYLKDVTQIAEDKDTMTVSSVARTLHLYAQTRAEHNRWVTGLAKLCPDAFVKLERENMRRVHYE